MAEKRIPYADTCVPASRSKEQIDKMLHDYGADAMRWTVVRDQSPVLEFVFTVTVNGTERKLGFRITAPHIEVTRVRDHQRVHAYNENASYRVLWWYLKSRLEAVSLGMETIEEALMTRILLSLPDEAGNVVQTTVGDEVRRQIVNPKRKGLLPSFHIDGEALPEEQK